MPGYTLYGTDLTDPHAVYGRVHYPGVNMNPNPPPVMTIPVAPTPKPSSDGSSMSANLKFNVPADAKLYVDGQLAPGNGTERAFYTPTLEPRKEYFYEVYAERTVDGKLVATNKKKVVVESGKSITIEFEELTSAKRVLFGNSVGTRFASTCECECEKPEDQRR